MGKRQYLVDARLAAGFTQAEAAKALGLSQNHISNIERGERQSDIGVHLLMSFAKLYHASFQYFKEELKGEFK